MLSINRAFRYRLYHDAYLSTSCTRKRILRHAIPKPGKEEISPRWQHIESLADGTNASEWREAIIEADIMLDDLLAKKGYRGDGVGEKLKSVEPARIRHASRCVGMRTKCGIKSRTKVQHLFCLNHSRIVPSHATHLFLKNLMKFDFVLRGPESNRRLEVMGLPRYLSSTPL